MNNYDAELSRRHLIDFIKNTKDNYSAQWFHFYICMEIERFILDPDCSRLMIFVPPQHGKSEISSRRLPPWILGRFPDTRIILTTYNQTFASKFNRQIQGIMSSDEYKEIFEGIRLPAANEPYACNSMEIELPGHEGSIKTIGKGGAITGNKGDIIILDDIYRDASEAYSPIERKNVEEWYSTTIETRLHNKSKVLIVFTRWHQDDLAGYLLYSEPELWKVIRIPAIRGTEENIFDPRRVKEALWPEHLSVEKLLKIQRRDKHTFSSLYQQDPRPSEGYLYTEFKEHEFDDWGFIEAIVDVADSGNDFLCSIVYEHRNGLAYVKDVVYTQDGHRVTKQMLLNQFRSNNVNNAEFESNNQGNIFADDIADLCRENGLNVNIEKKYQSKNKEARILGASNIVNEKIVMPKGWAGKFPIFYDDVSRFMRLFKSNKHDDAPDCLTSIAEKLTNPSSGIC